MKQERRKSPRFVIRQMIRLGEGREEYLWAKSLNLSKVGLGCITNKSLQPLDRIFGMITLHTEEEEKIINFEGYVVRSRPLDSGYELGIAFTEIDPADSDYIAQHVSEPQSE